MALIKEQRRFHREIRARLIKAREEQGLSHEEVGRRMGVGGSRVKEYESGKYDPSLAALETWMDAVGREMGLVKKKDGAETPREEEK